MPLTPLERGELSQFKVVAILASGTDRHAMVEDGTGKGYLVKIGTYIGKNGGKVTNIFSDHMVVEEKFVDIYGQTNSRRHAIKLRTSPGAGGRR
jgi:type IV pilus assembly protein PilP